MKNKLLKVLSVVLAFALVFGLLPPVELNLELGSLPPIDLNLDLGDLGLNMAPQASAKTIALLGDKVTVEDTGNTLTGTEAKLTATAKGSLFSKKDNTITITNTSGTKLEISVGYSVASAYSFTIDGASANASGTVTKQLDPNGTIKFYIKSNSGLSGTTVTLTLTNLTVKEVKDSSNVTFQYDSSFGSVTVAGTAVTPGGSVNISGTTGATLVASPNSGVSFLGWTDGDGKILSTAATYTLTPANDMTVKAAFAKNDGTGTPWFAVGAAAQKSTSTGLLGLGKLYYHTVGTAYLFDDLNVAAQKAASDASNKAVVLMNSGTLPAGDYTIPAGVTLLIPFDSANTMYTTAVQNCVDADKDSTADDWKQPTKFRELTMEKGANLTINGAMSLSVKQMCAQGSKRNGGSPTGPCSFVSMKEGSNITVNNGGKLYAYGFITGSGAVTVNNGASVYELFQFMDFRGGNLSTQLDNGVFPLSQYYVQNIEVPMTLYAGATEYAYTTIYMSSADFGSSVAFIASSNAMFNLTSGYVVKDYDENTDRLMVQSYGDITVNSINMEVGTSSINSKDYELPINSNITLTAYTGNLSINQDIALLPGAEIIVKNGVTCTLGKGNNIYIYDADEWGKYCAPQNYKFLPLTYAPGRRYDRTEADLKDALVDVNGVMNAGGGCVYTTAGGANIISSEGTGVVTIKIGSENITYQVTQSGNTADDYPKIPITSAKLKNADGTYALTEKAAQGSTLTMTYTNGKWVCTQLNDSTGEHAHTWDEGTVTKNASCTETGIRLLTCTVCGETKTETIAATGHTYVAGEPVWSNDKSACTITGTCSCGVTDTETVQSTAQVTEADCQTPYTVTYTATFTKEWIAEKTVTLTDTGDTDPNKHSYQAVVTPPTCTDQGFTTYTCTVCGHSYVSDYVDANGHSYQAVVTPPTCTDQGFTTYTCTVCGHSYVSDYVDANGHSYQAVVTPPTCTDQGFTTYTCTVCGHSYVSDYVDANGHNYVAGDPVWSDDKSQCAITGTCACGVTDTETVSTTVVVTEADCQTAYSATYTATFTKEWIAEKTVTVTVTGDTDPNKHSYQAVVTPPTCTDQGFTTYTCTVCGDSYVSDYVDANGHSYDAGVVTKAPTCTDTGIKTFTCTVCGHTYTETIAATGHSYNAVVTPPTCTEQGFTTYTCTVCGHSYVSDYVDANPNKHPDDCLTTTYTPNGGGKHTCTVTCKCGATISTEEQDCVDENSDNLCDLCQANLHVCAHDHYEFDENNHWSVCACGKIVEGTTATHSDETTKDHHCDVCGEELTTCADNDNDHNCDVCDKELTTCADNDNDHHCDAEGCKAKLSDCDDGDDENHDCDYTGCNKPNVDDGCYDNIKDHFCDECKTAMNSCADFEHSYTDNGDGTHDETCTYCNMLVADDADHRYNASGTCDCGNTAEAKVGETYYCFFEEAVAAAQNGDTIVLLKDVVLTEKLTVSTKQTWDFGAYTVTIPAVDGNYGLIVKGELTVESGKFVAEGMYGIGVTGKLTVNGGEFSVAGDNDYLLGNWGTTVINGGTFTGQYSCVNNFSGTTEIYGGSFSTAAYDYTGEYESCDLFADSGLTVYGGSFSKNVTEYCADGYHTADADNDGIYTYESHSYTSVYTAPTFDADAYTTYTCACGHSYVETHENTRLIAVAQVGETRFETLAEAVAAAGNGETVTLLQNVVLTEKLTVNTKQTWDFGAYTVTIPAVDGNYGLIVKGELTVESGKFVAEGMYGIGVTGKLTVNGGEFSVAGDNDYLLGNWGTTVINGGTFRGQYNCVNNFSGTTEIYGGSFSTAAYDYTGEYESCDLFADSGLTVYGGSFSKDVTEYCADGYHTADADNDGIYTYESHSYTSVYTAPTFDADAYTTYTCACGHSYVETHENTRLIAVAQVGETRFETLAEAVAAAGNGETVTLLQNVVLTEKLTVSTKQTWDFGAYTVTIPAVDGNYGLIVKGELTVESGKFVAEGMYGIGVTGKLTVNGGEFSVAGDNDYLLGNWGTTVINGGTFTGQYSCVNNFGGATEIYGGSFSTAAYDYTGEYESCDLFADSGLTVYGGSFSKNVTEYCADGFHTLDADADGVFTYEGHSYTSAYTAPTFDADAYTTYTCACGHSYVETHENTRLIAVAQVGETRFETLAEAVAAAGNGETVTLLQNVVLTEKLTVNTKQTWDFGAYTVTIPAVDGNYGLIVKGELTVESGKFVVEGMYGIGVTGKLTVNGGEFSVAGDNDYLLGNWGTTVINGGTFRGQYSCVNNFSGTTEIYGGSFSTAAYDYTGEYESCDLFADSGLTVYGGSFSKNVTEYCVMGYHTIDTDGDGIYTYGEHRYGNLQVFTFCDEDGYILITCPDCGNTYDSRYDAEAQQYLIDYPFFNLNPQGHIYDDDFDATCNRENCDHVREAKTLVAMIGEQKFDSLAAAVAAAQDGDTIVLCRTTSGAGVVIDKSVTIDFGGYTYSFTEGVGSTGTASNGFQILQGNTVVLKNGTLNVSEADKREFYALIQNYANLTVTDMTLDGTNLDKWSLTDGDSYVLSNNSGTVNVNGNTTIIANDDGDKAFAFDVCKYGSYAAPVVNIQTTGTIYGMIEVTESISDNLTISGGSFTVDVTEYCADGFHTVDTNNDGIFTYEAHADNDHDHFCDGCGISMLLGDLDLDGDVDANDLTLLSRHVSKIELLTGQALINADVDRDGDADADDMTLHARYVAKIITTWDEDEEA